MSENIISSTEVIRNIYRAKTIEKEMYDFLFLWNPNGMLDLDQPPTHPNPNGVRILKTVRNIGRSLIRFVVRLFYSVRELDTCTTKVVWHDTYWVLQYFQYKHFVGRAQGMNATTLRGQYLSSIPSQRKTPSTFLGQRLLELGMLWHSGIKMVASFHWPQIIKFLPGCQNNEITPLCVRSILDVSTCY